MLEEKQTPRLRPDRSSRRQARIFAEYGGGMNVVDGIIGLFARRGGDAYFSEPVSQLGHALQTAFQAEQEGAPDNLIAAARLHVIGHLPHKRVAGRDSKLLSYMEESDINNHIPAQIAASAKS